LSSSSTKSSGETVAMGEPVAELLAQAGFYRCVLLAHPEVARLRREAARLALANGWPTVPIGPSVAAALLATPTSERPGAAERACRALLEAARPGPVVCTDIDLLFEPSLRLDPLAVLREASRVTALVVAWPGTFGDGRLAYAVPEHAHYRIWRNPEVPVSALA